MNNLSKFRDMWRNYLVISAVAFNMIILHDLAVLLLWGDSAVYWIDWK